MRSNCTPSLRAGKLAAGTEARRNDTWGLKRKFQILGWHPDKRLFVMILAKALRVFGNRGVEPNSEPLP